MLLTARSAEPALQTVQELIIDVLQEDFSKLDNSIFSRYVGVNATVQPPPPMG